MTKRIRPLSANASVAGTCLTAVLLAANANAQAADPGGQVFASRCAACHGTAGGGGELGPSIVSRIPLRSDQELEAVIREGLTGAGMPAFGTLSKTEVSDLVAFLRTLRPATAGPRRTTVQLAGGQALQGIVLNQSPGELQLLGDDRAVHLLREGPAGRYRAVTSETDWPTYNGHVNGNRYSTLTQITAANVSRLRPKWTFTLPNAAQLQVTPVVVDGVMYVTAANDLYALDAGSGRQIWNYRRPRTRGLSGVAARGVNRGVAVAGERVFMTTDHAHLVALNRATGAVLWETTMADWRQNYNGTGAPLVVDDMVISGIAGGDEGARGFVAAFDQATGKEVWRFWAVPARGEPGSETWKGDSAQYTGNAGVWGPFSADPQLGYVYLSIESATNDVYGGHRPGNNLFSGSLVCLDIKTGKMIWYQQLVHHDIWDYDMPPHPILINLTVDGKPVRAVVQLTKQAFAYVFDRTNGRPVFGWEERPVPQTDVPKEWTSPTQPFPTKPPAFDKQGITIDDLIDFTPELRAEAIEAVKAYKLGPIYTPGTLAVNGHKGTIVVPGLGGGANWPGGAADPETGFVYVGSTTTPGVIGLSPNTDPKTSGVDTDYTYVQGLPTIQGLRLMKPPYGRITAYNMNRGEIAWQIPNGDTPPSVKNNPALKGLTIPKTGSPSQAGIMVTKTLVFAGEGAGGQAVFHAYDKATGEEIWQTPLPGPQVSLPMTYVHDGRQFIVVGARGTATSGAQLIAFAFPPPDTGRGGRGGRGGAPGGGRGGANPEN